MSSKTKVPQRYLGRDGPLVSAIGIGLMGLGGVSYGDALPDEERLAFLDRAWELGCTFWDSSDVYGSSEEIIGKWFKLHPERRRDIFLATKFGLTWDGVGVKMDSTPEYCRQAIEASLEKLEVDSIDLYYIHRLDEKTPIEKTMHELVKLKNEGKIKHIGISECSSTSLRRAYAVHPVVTVQVEYNAWDVDIENENGTNLLATCRELGVATVAYAPLGRGILTGQVRSRDDFAENDFRRNLERYSEENFPKNLAVVDTFTEIAKKKQVTTGQLALAWILQQGEDFVPIPGTKKVKYLEENFAAVNVHLTEAEEKEIRQRIDAASITGARGLQGLMNEFADTPEL